MTIFARIGKVVLARAGGGGTTPPVTREAVEMTDTCEPLCIRGTRDWRKREVETNLDNIELVEYV